MRIPIDGGHFLSGQGALSAVYLSYISESATRPCGKMAPSHRVGPQIRPYVVTYTDIGQGRELGAASFAPCLFGTTKLRSARLVWPDLKVNAGHSHSVNRS